VASPLHIAPMVAKACMAAALQAAAAVEALGEVQEEVEAPDRPLMEHAVAPRDINARPGNAAVNMDSVESLQIIVARVASRGLAAVTNL